MPETSPPAAAAPASASAPAQASFVQGIWERIKQHKVVQWTLAYLALAYTLLHGAELLQGSLGWPHAVVRVTALLLIIGVPLVVIVAWYHGARGQRHASGTEIMIIAILLALGGAFVWHDTRTRHAEAAAAEGALPGEASGAAPSAASIAVLPFTDLSPEGNQGYFSDGVTEEILNVLAHVGGLKVASRTSSFQFRNSDLGIPAIARRLGVRNILEGSVRKAGDTVRVTAQLVDAASDRHLWSQDFDRPLTTADLFGIQDEIAAAIVNRLSAILGAGASVGKPTLPRADTASVDVYDLYLKGHALFLARSAPNLSEAAKLLEAAVARDPKFARAWESLAAVRVISRFWGLREEADYDQAALEAADRALALDPDLSLAYAVRARVQLNRISYGQPGSWDEALANFGQAIRHDAQNATAYLWRSGAYFALGYLEPAHADLQRCVDLDPAYETCRRNLAFTELCEGRTEAALRLYEVGLAQDYSNDDVYFAHALAARGDRIGVLGALLQQYREQPQLVQPLFRALTDPSFGPDERQQALMLLKPQDFDDGALGAFWILKAYDRMSAVATDTPLFWMPGDPDWLKSAARKHMMERWRLPEYWRAHGFPPQCKPEGAADFTCPQPGPS